MSMNLYCDQATLWQTPTWITHIALYNRKGKMRDPKETLYIYKAWVRQSLNGVWKDGELEEARDRIDRHFKDLDIFKITSFWEM